MLSYKWLWEHTIIAILIVAVVGGGAAAAAAFMSILKGMVFDLLVLSNKSSFETCRQSCPG